jgi:hypothetical protein
MLVGRGMETEDISAGLKYFSIRMDGNIGIGTITPSEKLEVTGTVKATEFKFGNNSIKETSSGGFCIGNCDGVN